MKKVWDRLGIAFSSACVVHCLMVVFLPLFFPFLKEYTHASWIHVVVAILILFTSPLAFVPGYRKHGITWIIGSALMGLFFIVTGILLEERVSEIVSHGVSVLGSTFLVFAHFKNIQHSHRHQHQCC